MQKNKNTVKAVNRNVRSSPRKINILLKNIRGKKADVAIRDLSFARQRIAFDIKKTVETAIANAKLFLHHFTKACRNKMVILTSNQHSCFFLSDLISGILLLSELLFSFEFLISDISISLS